MQYHEGWPRTGQQRQWHRYRERTRSSLLSPNIVLSCLGSLLVVVAVVPFVLTYRLMGGTAEDGNSRQQWELGTCSNARRFGAILTHLPFHMRRRGQHLVTSGFPLEGASYRTVASLQEGHNMYEGTALVPCKVNPEACRRGKIIVHNPSQRHNRTYCEVSLPPNATIPIQQSEFCVESMTKRNAIVLGQGQGLGGSERFEDCDVGCMKASRNKGDIPVHGTPWSFTYSMEGPQYYGNLRHDKAAPVFGFIPQKTEFWATTSFESTIPLPYFSWSEYNIQTNAVGFDAAEPAASFIAKNCNSKSNREEWVRGLQTYGMRVDSVSRCLKNAEPANGVGNKNKTRLMHQYLFHLAFENQIENDYITEKLWGSLCSGTLPVYLGAPNVKEHVPPHSIIVANDFDDPKALAKYLLYLMGNRTAYQEYHKWREGPLPHAFVQKYDFTRVHSICRICRWSYARIHGLGWDHAMQSIVRRAGMVPMKLNVSTGMVNNPFQEEWILVDADYSGSGGERLKATLGTREEEDRLFTFGTVSFETSFGEWKRVASEGDGYIDIRVEPTRSLVERDVVVRLHSHMQGNDVYHTLATGNKVTLECHQRERQLGTARAKYPNTTLVSIMDNQHRFTVMGTSGLQMGSPGNGLVEIILPGRKPWGGALSGVTLRIAIEKLNLLRDSSHLTIFCQGLWDELQHPTETFTLAKH